MRTLRKLIGAAAIVVLSAGGLGVVTIPAMAVDVQPRACALTANTPVKVSGTQMRSYGGRGNCTNSATVTVMLKRDISGWPDSIVNSEKRTNVTNAYWNVYGNGAYGSKYYTQTDSSTGATLQSSRIIL